MTTDDHDETQGAPGAGDRMFGRREQFDEASRGYGVAAVLEAPQLEAPVTKRWDVPPPGPLDQHQTLKCVGFSITHFLIAMGLLTKGADTAAAIFKGAQRIDGFPDRGNGTSVIAGMKTAKSMGFIGAYRWAFGEQEAAAAVSHLGPVVLGIPWTSGMSRPNRDGFIRPTGSDVGGHAILDAGIDVEGDFHWLFNSWGPEWGDNGWVKIRRADLANRLQRRGEACIPTAAVQIPIPKPVTAR